MPNLNISQVYTFNTNAPSVLGATIKNAKLIGIVDYNSALKLDNVLLKFRQIYPLLPAGTLDNPEACVFYVFRTESGAEIVLADQWIDDTTVTLVEGVNFTITLTNASNSDISRIRDALNALGYTNYNIRLL